ncbi:MAG: hypothetical protein GX971_15215 [Firmicutes bacterium]|nr:hypothetical protein [Bacillota bacterium]
MRIRKLFAGSNSAKGFYSLFHNIIGPDAKKVYLLKGGPGTGKASFMRTIADELREEGLEQELFFCSSDSRSLDAVTFPELGVALVDATSPHTQDAKWPGCRDELVCLGNFWSSKELEKKRVEIVEAGLAKASYFAQAFRYFAAALFIEENMASRNSKHKRDVLEEVGVILAELQGARKSPRTWPTKARHLFASALTPEGYVSQIEELVADYSNRYILTGLVGTGKSEYLDLILTHGELAGLTIEVYHYPLNPEKILHLLVPELGLAVLTANELEPLAHLSGRRIDCGHGQENHSNATDQRLFRELIDLGIKALQDAQASHASVETYYAQSMDFSAVNQLRERLTKEILSYRNRS